MNTFRTSRPVTAAELDAAGEPHLVLVGLPGSGKSTVGQAVAAELGRNFIDIDAEIERRELISIGEIFATRGEKRFRDLEKKVTEELAKVSGFVVAPGAGWIANPGCLELLRPPANLIYLQIQPDRALKRMAGQASVRPLLRRPDPLAELTKLLAEREALYLLADHTVRVDFQRETEVINTIVALARAKKPD
jgi:shikimate kinase